MSIDAPVGKLFCAEDAMVVEWEIANFSTLSDKEDAAYYSPNFGFSDACWCLVIYPNIAIKEFRPRRAGPHVGLFVRRVGKSSYSIHITLCLKDETGIEKYEKNLTHKLEREEDCGSRTFCRRSEILASTLLPADVLTVRCKLQNLNRCPIRVSMFERFLKVSRNMKSILKAGKSSDVVLKLKGGNFHAHRAILETGSKVFAARFAHEMAESPTGELSIDDVDADVFEQVLSYMYSGRVDDLCADKVTKVYVAAEKYDLGELKELCTTYMEENMSVDLFCDVAILAAKYNDMELMKLAKESFRKNSSGILKSET